MLYNIEIHHDDHVATIEVDHHTVNDALEYAFAATQNILGSWSRGEFFEDGTENLDYSANIVWVKPLVDNLGHRSSMVGDIFVIFGSRYVVENFGFKEIV